MVVIWGEALRHDCINAEVKVRRKESYEFNWSTSGTRRKILRPGISCEGLRVALVTPLVGSVFVFDLRGGRCS